MYAYCPIVTIPTEEVVAVDGIGDVRRADAVVEDVDLRRNGDMDTAALSPVELEDSEAGGVPLPVNWRHPTINRPRSNAIIKTGRAYRSHTRTQRLAMLRTDESSFLPSRRDLNPRLPTTERHQWSRPHFTAPTQEVNFREDAIASMGSRLSCLEASIAGMRREMLGLQWTSERDVVTLAAAISSIEASTEVGQMLSRQIHGYV